MSPKKQPTPLFCTCARKCVFLVNRSCLIIEQRCESFEEYEQEVLALNGYLRSQLPMQLLEVLSAERGSHQHVGDPRGLILALSNPLTKVFRKCNYDYRIPLNFWVTMLSNFHDLVILDLKFICTDEILQVIGKHCLKIQELNIVSRVELRRSFFNADVMVRLISDEGLVHVGNLKLLRKLTMDPPRNRFNKVTQAGIVRLISELPNLVDLRIDNCDIGSTLIRADGHIGPLSLQKINCHVASDTSIKKLLRICPNVTELSVTYLSVAHKDAILNEIAASSCKLNKLGLSFFSYTPLVKVLLASKGSTLTSFSLWETESELTIEAVLVIGKYCPNLHCLCLMTHSSNLNVPRNYNNDKLVYKNLRVLTIGYDSFSIEPILNFFLANTECMHKLMIKYQTKKNIDGILLRLLKKGQLRHLHSLWLDCTLQVSKKITFKIVRMCEHLNSFTMDFGTKFPVLQRYIVKHNLDLKLGTY